MLKTYTDTQIIEAFRQGGHHRNSAWEFAFKTWKGRIIGKILRSGGTREEAMDAIQEAHIHFENRVKRDDFVLEHSLFSYFNTCVYRAWTSARKADKSVLSEVTSEKLSDFASEVEKKIIKGELARLLDETVARIGPRCQSILRLLIQGFSMREIAEEMGFAGGEQVAKNEKKKCMERYEKYLDENPAIKEQLKNLFHG